MALAFAAAASQSTLAANFCAEIILSGLGCSITDMNPNDGIEAGVTLANQFSRTQTYSYLFSEKNNKTYFDRNIADGFFAPFDAGNLAWQQHRPVRAQPQLPGHARAISITWGENGLSMSLSGITRPVPRMAGGFDVDLFTTFSVTLAPHTSTVWEANFEMSVAVDGSPKADYRGLVSASYGAGELVAVTPSRGPKSDFESGIYRFVISNPTDGFVEQRIDLSMNIYAVSPVANPVPAPSAYALMACGLGLVRVWTKRRRQRAQEESPGAENAQA